jgi:hypothetical protein
MVKEFMKALEKGRTCVKGKDSLTHVPINAIDING